MQVHVVLAHVQKSLHILVLAQRFVVLLFVASFQQFSAVVYHDYGVTQNKKVSVVLALKNVVEMLKN